MMGQGLTSELVFAAAAVFVFGVLMTSRALGLGAALSTALIKSGLPLIYFAYLYRGEMLLKDDQVYFAYSTELFLRGFGPLNILLDPAGLEQIKAVVGSQHILYYWWNLLAFSFFGVSYYAPVFLNVALTFAAGAALMRYVRAAGFSCTYTKCFGIFFLLHWDILTWSSFFNLKDMLVLTLTILSLSWLAELGERLRLRPVLGLAGVIWCFSRLRYYLPLLLLAASAVWFAACLKQRRVFLLLIIGAGLAAAYALGPESSGRDAHHIQLVLPFYPAIRFLLMPQFWTLQPNEHFLFPATVMHWLLFGPLLFGAAALWGKGARCRLVLIYMAVLIAFYSLVPELQGYRHRLQLCFIIGWCQFEALWNAFAPRFLLSGETVGPPAAATELLGGRVS